MTMPRRTIAAYAALAFVLALDGCTPAAPSAQKPPSGPTATPSPSGGIAGGTRIANGLYDQPDGTVVAVGTLEWSDLEGGFWAITGAPEAAAGTNGIVAVVANVPKDDPAYVKLVGMTVRVIGTRISGASARMAGPEITATSISAFNDTNLPAG
jgi:hypothetical protein